MLNDTLGSVGVIVAAVIIHTTGFYLADPVISAAIGLFIPPRTWGLMRQAIHILMEGVPPHLDVREIEAAMATVPGVRAVHDLHVWTLTSGKDAMSSHVIVADLAANDRILRDLHRLLHERFGIEHTTLQLESEPLVQIVAQAHEPSPTERSGDRNRHDADVDHIAAWADTFQVPQAPPLFQREVRAVEDGIEYWMPVQEILEPAMTAELSPGDEIEVFVIHIGQMSDRQLFLINKFLYEGHRD